MERFKFEGDLDLLIEYFKFEKVEQSPVENMVFEFYEKKIQGADTKMMIQIQVQHHPEHTDTVTIFLLSNIYGTGSRIRLNIQSVVDMTMLLGIIQKNT